MGHEQTGLSTVRPEDSRFGLDDGHGSAGGHGHEQALAVLVEQSAARVAGLVDAGVEQVDRTAAALRLPVVFVCFVNHEYRLLKDLWVQFTGGDFDTTRFVGLDFDDPPLDLDAIMRGFGATTERLTALDDVDAVVDAARSRRGPTVVFVDRRP